jgi:hypothetical protein
MLSAPETVDARASQYPFRIQTRVTTTEVQQ